MAVSKPLDEDLQFNMTEAWSGLQHIATMCCTMNSSRLGKYLRALVSKGKLHGTHTHTHEYRHTHWIFIINSACLHRWVKQILKSVNVGGCLASCQSNNGNWVSVCVCVCVLRLPVQADQVSQTNAASSTWLSFREHALVPRVLCLKNRRGLSTIECTWARRAPRMKSSSNRKYAKEVIEPFFFSLWFYTHCCWCFCGQPSGIHTQLDNQAEIEKRKVNIDSCISFYFYFF